MNQGPSSDEEFDPYAETQERSHFIHEESQFASSPELDGQETNANTGFSSLNWLYILSIICELLLGLAVAIANHVFFAHLDGKRTDDLPQFWVTSAKNAIPKVVQVLWSMALASSAAQTMWFVVGRRPFTLARLDDIFSSSNPLNIISLILRGKSFLLLPLLYIQLGIILLVLLSVLIPGTLTVRQARMQVVSAQVPYINMSAISPPDAAYLDAAGAYKEASATFMKIALQAATSGITPTWDPPSGCDDSCSYVFRYDAPALRCIDIDPGHIWNDIEHSSADQEPLAYLGFVNADSPAIYNGTSNIVFDVGPGWGMSWPNFSSYNLTITTVSHFSVADWRNNSDHSSVEPALSNVIGSSCMFYDATYQASVTFENNTQTTSIEVVSYHLPLLTGDCGPDACIADGRPLPQFNNISISNRAMAEAFSRVLVGNLSYMAVWGQVVESSVIPSALFWNPLFDFSNLYTDNFTLDLAVPSKNLSEGLTSLFANVTLAFVSASPSITEPSSLAFTTTNVTVTPSFTIYVYDVMEFWLIYGAGMIIVVIGAGFGVWCMGVNGSGTQVTFTTIVAATRHSDVDLALGKRDGVRLTYGRVDTDDDEDTFPQEKLFRIVEP